MFFIFNAPNKVKENVEHFLFQNIYLYSLCCQQFWECVLKIRIKFLEVCSYKCNTEGDVEKT